jgi:hypothetical protein
VKTGNQSLSGFVEKQIQKDQYLQSQGYAIVWAFLPNRSGVESASGPLMTALNREQFDVSIGISFPGFSVRYDSNGPQGEPDGGGGSDG